MTKQDCKKCHYRVFGANRIAECHRQPPTVMPVISANALGQPQVVAHVTSFPIVNDGMWCGEWREITEARAEPVLSKLLMPSMHG